MEKQTLQAVNVHLDTTIGIIKCHSIQKKAVFPPITQHQPANKSLAKQRPFFSTRKRKKTASIRIAKPTTHDKCVIENKLNLHSKMFTTTKIPYGTLLIHYYNI